MCPSLPIVLFGDYDSTDCTEQKIAHGYNCTINCKSGFEVKGNPVKLCGGKRTGTWSNRNKQPKCVGKWINHLFVFLLTTFQYFEDVTPPTIICPEGFSVPLADDSNEATVTYFPSPQVMG